MGQARLRKINGVLANLALKSAQELEAATKNMTPEMAALATSALTGIKKRSLADRNPSLGKMFKCQVCKTRHRGQQCEIKYFDKDAE